MWLIVFLMLMVALWGWIMDSLFWLVPLIIFAVVINRFVLAPARAEMRAEARQAELDRMAEEAEAVEMGKARAYRRSTF